MPIATKRRTHAFAFAAAAGALLHVASPASASDSPADRAQARSGLLPGTVTPLLVAEIASRAKDAAEIDRAVRSYMDAAHAHAGPAFARRAARIAARAERFPLAVEASSLWLELDPDNLIAQRMHALMLSRADRPEEAAAELRRIAWRPDATPRDGLNDVVAVLAREPDIDRRVGIMESLGTAEPESRYALARVLAGAGQVERALAILEVLRREMPLDDRYAVTQALLLHGEGNRAAALEALAHRESLGGRTGALLRTHARLLDSAGRLEEASGRYELLLERHPDDLDARWELGRLLMRLERFDEARPHFEVLYRSPGWRDAAWYFTGLIDHQSQETFDRALRAYRKVREGRYYVSARIRMAEIMTDSGDLRWARRHLAATPRYIENDDIRLYRAESSLLMRAERPHDALGVLDGALGTYPENDELLYARAMVAERIDRLDILEQDLRSIISRDPQHAEALNALGYTLADRTERYQEALDLVERALALDPDSFHIIDSMGWVLYRLGRNEEAAEFLRRSYEMEPDPVVAAHLGEVLWILGNRDEALEIWNSALEENPENEVLLETIERFGT